MLWKRRVDVDAIVIVFSFAMIVPVGTGDDNEAAPADVVGNLVTAETEAAAVAFDDADEAEEEVDLMPPTSCEAVALLLAEPAGDGMLVLFP